MFASLVPAVAAGSPDFSLNLSAQSATVAAGGAANLVISAAAVGGFNGRIALSCAAAAGLTCAFNPATISSGASASSTLTVSVASMPPTGGYGPGAMLSGIGLFGALLTTRKRKALTGGNILSMGVVGLLLLASLFTTGCGTTSKTQTAPASQVTLVVTGTSGSLKHSAPVTITVN